MGILLVGVNHKTAPVEVRERIHFQRQVVPEALRRLVQLDGVKEGLILSTCNRVEVLTYSLDLTRGAAMLKEFVANFHSLPPAWLDPFFYTYSDTMAIRHVFRVASSLDSLVVGEPQILGQVKEAYMLACEAGTVGIYLNPLMHRAFHVAKRVRSETGIAEAAVSISYAAVELARKIFGDLRNKTALIVGAGKMSELSTKHLKRAGISSVLVSNRTHERALELARMFGGEAVRYDDLFAHMARADIVITSTGAAEFIICRADAQRLIELRKNRPIFFIDISVPRNVDPEVNKVDNVFAYDIDDLEGVVQANLKERQRESQAAEKLIDEEVDFFSTRLGMLDLNPVIIALREKIEQICYLELERYLRKAGNSDPEQQRELRQMTTRIVNKIVHPMIAHLRQPDTNANQRAAYIETIKRIFEL